MAEPWERQPGEPGLWWARFELFLGLGPRRSVLAVYRPACGQPQAATLPGAWRVAAERWDWRRRAALWDEQQATVARAEAAEQGREQRAELRSLAVDLANKLKQIIPKIPLKGARLKDAADVLKALAVIHPVVWPQDDADVEATLSEEEARAIVADSLQRGQRAEVLRFVPKGASDAGDGPGGLSRGGEPLASAGAPGDSG